MYFCRFASVNPEQESKRGLPHCRLRDAFLFYDAAANVLWKTATEPAPQLFPESRNSLEVTSTQRLNADIMYKEMCLALQNGYTKAPSVSRHRYVERASLQLPSVAWTSGETPVMVALFELPHVIIQLAHDPAANDRVAAASADGALVVVTGVAIEWRSDFHVADIFSAIEAIVWCGAFLIACGSGGSLLFFKPGPANRSSPCASIQITGAAAVGADSYVQGNAVVQCVAAFSKLVVCAAGRTISLITVTANRTNKPSLGQLVTLPPLSTSVVALRLIPELLIAATLGQGCVLWRRPLTLGTPTTPDVVLRCSNACLDIHVLGKVVIASCSDFTVRFWKQNDENCFTLGGLRNRTPRCCAARSSLSDQNSVVLAIADGDSGVLLWPLDEKSAPFDSLGLDSRRARRLLNKSCHATAINVAAVAVRVFVLYDNGSLNVFMLSSDMPGLNATLTAVYSQHAKWRRGANLSPLTNDKQHGASYATPVDTLKSLVAYLAP